MSQLNGIDKPSENEYLKCIHCGLCLAVCPTYREQLTETASPRGRVVLVRISVMSSTESGHAVQWRREATLVREL